VGECTAEASQLLQLAVSISNALVDLGMLSFRYIPQFPKSVHEVLMAAGFLLEFLREAQTSSACLWD
jgi:hypothetical protein